MQSGQFFALLNNVSSASLLQSDTLCITSIDKVGWHLYTVSYKTTEPMPLTKEVGLVTNFFRGILYTIKLADTNLHGTLVADLSDEAFEYMNREMELEQEEERRRAFLKSLKLKMRQIPSKRANHVLQRVGKPLVECVCAPDE